MTILIAFEETPACEHAVKSIPPEGEVFPLGKTEPLNGVPQGGRENVKIQLVKESKVLGFNEPWLI